MPATASTAIAVIGIDIGKNSFHIVGLDDRAANNEVRGDEDWRRSHVSEQELLKTARPWPPF